MALRSVWTIASPIPAMTQIYRTEPVADATLAEFGWMPSGNWDGPTPSLMCLTPEWNRRSGEPNPMVRRNLFKSREVRPLVRRLTQPDLTTVRVPLVAETGEI